MSDFQFGPIQTAWLEALESGKYQQGQKHLREPGTERFCCLGVLCEVMGLERRPDGYKMDEVVIGDKTHEVTNTGYLSADVPMRAGLRSHVGAFKDGVKWEKNGREAYSLIGMNDRHNATFADIAEFMRAQPEAVFSHAA